METPILKSKPPSRKPWSLQPTNLGFIGQDFHDKLVVKIKPSREPWPLLQNKCNGNPDFKNHAVTETPIFTASLSRKSWSLKPSHRGNPDLYKTKGNGNPDFKNHAATETPIFTANLSRKSRSLKPSHRGNPDLYYCKHLMRDDAVCKCAKL